jgi:uncharacterized protein
MMTATKQKTSAPFHVMVKPVGPICNLDCKYCFYLEKEKLFDRGEKFRMSEETLERFVRDYIQAQPNDHVVFAWQGGEPTLMGVDFFRKAVAWQKQYGQGKTIENAFQTNGTLINDEWALFFKENAFLIGVSIDGPRELHDHYRVDKGGQPTWEKVMRGIDFLKKHGVEFNTLTCVNRETARKPLEIYRFLKGIGSTFLQFIPILERRPDSRSQQWNLELASPPLLGGLHSGDEAEEDLRVMPWTVKASDYGDFLIQIFDRWVRRDVGRIYVQMFDLALSKWLGIPGGLCIFSETCGSAMAMEHNGDLYSCDHYVYPDYRIGNIMNQAMPDLVDSVAQKKFGTDKRDTLPKQCRECAVKFACNGGCPKHRFIETKEGEAGLNYLCEGYLNFFQHVDPYMRVMAQLYRSRRAPAEIMELIKQKKIPGIR